VIFDIFVYFLLIDEMFYASIFEYKANIYKCRYSCKYCNNINNEALHR
jgi:hypothetical protein